MTTQERDWLTYAGISVVALAAAVMSFAAWSELGTLVGITQTWNGWRLAWLLPLSVDVYAVVTARVWLRSTTASEATRTYAKRSSMTAISMSLAGNALYHLIVATKFTASGWWPLVVVAVSGIPALQLGLALHLAALVARDRAPAPEGAAGSVTDAASPAPVTEPARHLFAVPGQVDAAFAELDREQARTEKREQKAVRRPDRTVKLAPEQKPNRSRAPKTEQKPAASVRPDSDLIEQVQEWCREQDPEQTPGQLSRYRVEQITGASGRQADRVLAALTEQTVEVTA